jgi:hypothetical protein
MLGVDHGPTGSGLLRSRHMAVSKFRRRALVVGGLLVVVALPLRFRRALRFIYRRLRGRNANLTVMRDTAGREALLMGTIHNRHMDTPGYGLSEVQAMVQNVDFELVAVEVIPSEIDKGFYGEGQIEMPVVTLTARERNIRVVGIDESPSLGWGNRHNRMNEHIDSIIADIHWQRVLIVAGSGHMPSFSDVFMAAGFIEVDVDDDTKNRWFTPPEPQPWPAGLLEALEQAMARRGTDDDELRLRNSRQQTIDAIRAGTPRAGCR